jgi:predicted DNA-binding ArsR family transcriptional regulator
LIFFFFFLIFFNKKKKKKKKIFEALLSNWITTYQLLNHGWLSLNLLFS